MSEISDIGTIKQGNNINHRFYNNKRIIFFEKMKEINKFKLIFLDVGYDAKELFVTKDTIQTLLSNMNFFLIKEN